MTFEEWEFSLILYRGWKANGKNVRIISIYNNVGISKLKELIKCIEKSRREGEKLLEICEEQGLRILNGRIEGDTEGN